MSYLASHSGKKLILMIIIVAVLVVAIGGGAVLGSRLLGHGKGKRASADSDKQQTEKTAKADKDEKADEADKNAKDSKADEAADGDEKSAQSDEGKADEEKSRDEKGKDGEKPEVVSLGDFLVNLVSPSGVRYLRAEVSVALTGLPAAKEGHGGGKGAALPPGDLAIARDRVVAVLSAGDFAQLRSVTAREGLKKKILARLQSALPNYELSEVLFTAFVMQ